MSRLGCLALLVLSARMFGQVSANSVTVTASRSATVQPDEVYFAVFVSSGADKNLDDIVGALKGTGITAANFVRLTSLFQPVGPTAPPHQSLQWTFQILVPLAKLKDTTAAFAALAQSLQQQNNGLSLTFAVQGTAVSPQQTPSCKLADLIADARAQAQQLTSAAGVTPGMIQSLIAATSPAAPTPCYLTVRFLLGTQLMRTEPSSITITASRPLTVQPDQIAISLNVTSDPTAGLDDITAALQQAGISGATFTGLYTTTIYVNTGGTPGQQSRLQWNFTLTAPLAKLTDTLSLITAAQQGFAKAGSTLSLGFAVLGTQVSPALAQSQSCPDADLVKDAQAQAQAVAAAAGVSAGAIVNISGGGSIALVNAPGFVAAGDVSIGVLYPINTGITTVGGFLTYPPVFTSNCSLTVAFQLLQ